MRQIVFWSLLGLSLSVNLTVAAVAFGSGPEPRGVPGEPPLFSRVSLDADQRARITALRKELLADRSAQAARLATLRVELADALARDPADPAAVDAALAAIEAGQAAFQRRVVAHVLAVRGVLRPEQRPAFQALVQEHMRTGAPLDPSSTPGAKGGGRP